MMIYLRDSHFRESIQTSVSFFSKPSGFWKPYRYGSSPEHLRPRVPDPPMPRDLTRA